MKSKQQLQSGQGFNIQDGNEVSVRLVCRTFFHRCLEDLDLSFVFFLFFSLFFNSQEAASGKHKSSSKQGTWGSGHLFPAASGWDDPVPELRGVAARENKDVKPQTRRMGGDRLQGGNRKVTPLTRWQILFVLLRFSRISLQGSADLHKNLASKRRTGPISSWENDPFGGSFPAR